MMRKYILLLFVLSCSLQCVKAQDKLFQPPAILSDTATISLLTSFPWDGQIYALFGHTAIRINDPVHDIDIICNYGVFDFSASGFVFRFIRGETDYNMELSYFTHYIDEYRERGVQVTEQVLNLSQTEKQALYLALMINSLPENKVYRYDFFYDNCATRPRDIIEKCIDGKVIYTPTNKQQTYRDLVHECVNVEPWTRFGIDLIIGADADKIITDRQKDFLPKYLMEAYEGAVIKNTDGSERPLVLTSNQVLIVPPKLYHLFSLLPLITGCVLLLITALLSILIYRKKWFVLGKIYDTLLFLTAGFGGCIIFFLMFFSEHPCVNPNWNIVWLNPLQLIVAFLFFVKPLSKHINYYHFINFAVLLLFLLAWCLIPQQLDVAFIPYILTIMLRSAMNILEQKN